MTTLEREGLGKWWSERGFMLGTRAVTSKIWQAALSAAPAPLPGIKVDPDHLAALALNGSLGEEQTKGILTAVFAPTPPEVEE